MCRFDLPLVITPDNGTQFSNFIMINLCHDLGVQTKFISTVDLQANEQVESVNKVNFYGIKKKLDEAKRFLVEQLHKISW